MNRKGMGIAQTFIFIVAAITFALIMIFGYKAVQDFISSGEEVAFVQFKNNLEREVRQIQTDYGAVRVKQFVVPGKYKQVCFIDLDVKPGGEVLEGLRKQDAYAADIWKEAWAREDKKGFEAADQNVFLTPIQEETLPIKVDDISMENGYFCSPIQKGKFSLVLEGKGDHTELSQ